MNILGIYDGHNANAALIKDGKVIRAVEEERFSRIKNHDGRVHKGPINSIAYCIKDIERIDFISLALEEPNLLSLNAYNSFIEDILKNNSRKKRANFLASVNPRITDRNKDLSTYLLPSYPGMSQNTRIEKIKSILIELGLDNIPFGFVNHHIAHNASAYYTSGKSNGLCLSLDGKGDDVSGMVCVAKNGKIKEISRINYIESIGHFYSAITVALGFKAIRHEGKITGLAAYGGESKNLLKNFRNLFYLSDHGVLKSKLADDLVIGPYPHTDFSLYVEKIKKMIKGHKREDVSFCAQKVLEENVSKWAKYWIEKTNEENIFLSGGVFANVKLNQCIMDLEGVKFIYIHPAMSDAGLGVGAALYNYNEITNSINLKYQPTIIDNVYFGPNYSDEEILSQIKKFKLKYDEPKNLEKEIAQLLDKSKIIAIYKGGLEYGPRALGNRTIMYHTKDPDVNNWLNNQLNRTEFMPFAPVTLYEKADECYKIPRGKDPYYASKFMTITFDCTDKMKKESPAVVHVDGTARPQLITGKDNQFYYNILKEYYDITGIPSLVNTSFNMHEEPIVTTPKEAIISFLQSGLNYLSIGSYLIKKPNDDIKTSND